MIFSCGSIHSVKHRWHTDLFICQNLYRNTFHFRPFCTLIVLALPMVLVFVVPVFVLMMMMPVFFFLLFRGKLTLHVFRVVMLGFPFTHV